uniref:Uncharacterized protein n=1 Tax=Physcomitrium patens TaxID=3218 RepID=A0A2K1JJK9_PHYPA|nr:hypothetical protein PHYPA_018899 [Physcomitrium patens]
MSLQVSKPMSSFQGEATDYALKKSMDLQKINTPSHPQTFFNPSQSPQLQSPTQLQSQPKPYMLDLPPTPTTHTP